MIKKTVEDYLREVDYQKLKNYKPSAFAIEYMNFVKMVNAGKDDIQASPPAHYKMAESFVVKKTKIANLCCRGFAKTSVMAEFLVLYLAVFNVLPNFGKCNVIMFIGDSMENGCKSFRQNVEARYQHSAFLQKYIPEVKFTDTELWMKNISGEETYIKLFGAKSGVRGFKRNGDRPVLAIIDDIVSNEDANSKLVLDKIKDTIYKDIDNALNPKRQKIIFNGTPFNKDDPLYEAIESGVWHSNVYPICSQFPCSEEEFDGGWVERFDYAFVKQKYEEAVRLGKLKAFNQELMLRITSDEDRMVHDNDIHWFKRDEILAKKHQYNFYITTDFATSIARRADYTVIGVWAVDHEQNRYLVDGVIGRQLMSQTFNDIFRLVLMYQPMGVGIEASGQQGAFISLLRDEMVKRDIFFGFGPYKSSSKEGISVKTNKMERFRLSIPFWKNGKMFLPEELKSTQLVQEILDELSSVTIDGIKSKHDDCLDMISQLEELRIVYPSEQQAKSTLNIREGQTSPFDELESDGIGIKTYLV